MTEPNPSKEPLDMPWWGHTALCTLMFIALFSFLGLASTFFGGTPASVEDKAAHGWSNMAMNGICWIGLAVSCTGITIAAKR